MQTPKKILVAVDFSKPSEAALEYALGLGRPFDSTVEVLHVWEPPPYMGPDVLVLGGSDMRLSITDYTRRIAGQDMERLLDGLLRRGILGVKGRIERGHPADVICDFARTHGFDLVVLGTHGRTGISRLMAGSVAEKVLRSCPCPVLVVRAPGADASARAAATTEVHP